MYVPKHFRIEDPAWIRRFIDKHRFGTLVSVLDGRPLATHLPLWYDPEPLPHGVLFGHVARANPHAQAFGKDEALAIFTGPHAYVSPTWYRTTAPAVPTWNYAAVHAYGTPQALSDPGDVRALLGRLTEREERGFGEPYTVDGLDEEYLGHMMAQIVAFRMPVVRLEAKAKLSQNRTPEERRRVAGALGGDIAALMEELVIS